VLAELGVVVLRTESSATLYGGGGQIGFGHPEPSIRL
jgi:hypothetical protein